jgi:hypothetical protein
VRTESITRGGAVRTQCSGRLAASFRLSAGLLELIQARWLVVTWLYLRPRYSSLGSDASFRVDSYFLFSHRPRKRTPHRDCWCRSSGGASLSGWKGPRYYAPPDDLPELGAGQHRHSLSDKTYSTLRSNCLESKDWRRLRPRQVESTSASSR